MASAVLVQFDNDEQALAFVEKINGQRAWVAEAPRPFRAVGLWRLPTRFCDCGRDRRLKMDAFVRGSKYGWWVHTECGRPSKAWGHIAPRLWLSLGRNILEGVPDDGEPRTWNEISGKYDSYADKHDSASMEHELKVWYDPAFPKRQRRKREHPRRAGSVGVG